jgi:spermidine synthase
LPGSTASDLVLIRQDWRAAAFYLSIALGAGALIALQLAIMRVFAIGSWAHFGSLVVSLAMLGMGLSSAVLCAIRPLVERYGRHIAALSLLLFGPLVAGANLLAQQVPFNAVFMLSDPQQKWRLAANFALYLLPFVAGAMFLGTVFIANGERFGRVYFADLSGAGACGIVFLLAMCVVPPQDLIAVPLVLGLASAALWQAADLCRGGGVALVCSAAVSTALHFGLPPSLGITKLSISDYKGVAYARKLPDSRRVLHQLSPFGDVQVYASSYLHFAPGLSDNAAFTLTEMPKDAYLGLYLDGDGPIGVIRDLPATGTAYFGYLPMVYPYLIKPRPEVFVVHLAGGISTALALCNGARSVTVAEANPAILSAFASPELEDFTGRLLQNSRVRVVANEGRLFLRSGDARYDVIDLSLANSAGLSNPGGFSIVEQFAYTRQALLAYMRALKPGGVLAVTLWNKEDPPKSVLKLYATIVAAARDFDPAHVADSFFAIASYLSTTTVLYKAGGFSPDEIATFRAHTDAMSFDAIYYPSIAGDDTPQPSLLADYRSQIFGDDAPSHDDRAPEAQDAAAVLPAIQLGRLALSRLIAGDWAPVANDYVFDTRPLSDNRPYFAGYIKTKDLPRTLDRLEILQDDWGYLLLWVTFGVAALGAALLMALPACFGWRVMVSHFPGKAGIILFFASLGLGYIAVEIGLLSAFVLALSNYTISAAVVIPGMLFFSGIGSLLSQRFLDRARAVLPQVLGAIGVLLLIEPQWLSRALEWIGTLRPTWRLLCCLLLLLPPALMMGVPMPLAMTTLARLGKDRVFVWGWGINGCFSVVGAALVPLVATSFGLNAVLTLAGLAYLAAILAVGGLFRPLAAQPAQGRA